MSSMTAAISCDIFLFTPLPEEKSIRIWRMFYVISIQSISFSSLVTFIRVVPCRRLRSRLFVNAVTRDLIRLFRLLFFASDWLCEFVCGDYEIRSPFFSFRGPTPSSSTTSSPIFHLPFCFLHPSKQFAMLSRSRPFSRFVQTVNIPWLWWLNVSRESRNLELSMFPSPPRELSQHRYNFHSISQSSY